MNLTAAAAPVTPEAKQTAGNNDIVILHPNDVHCLFPPYKIIDYRDTQIAYIGIDPPESFTKSTPAYFQNEHGNYIYNFCQGNTKNLGGSVGKEYADPYGQGRITIRITIYSKCRIIFIFSREPCHICSPFFAFIKTL